MTEYRPETEKRKFSLVIKPISLKNEASKEKEKIRFAFRRN
jgi:hypothetical protein